MKEHEWYMKRCFQLAKLGAGKVAPNPMVGAVLVYNNIIIGEGYHEQYGQSHAEVNCINSVKKEQVSLIEKSTLYVSLEPCNHFGNTPPCSDLVIKYKIPTVVIGCKDLNAKVNGSGIKKLEEAGINIVVGVLEKEAMELNRRFFTFHLHKRPYIILKWAQSNDNFIAPLQSGNFKITHLITDKLVHKWRSESSAIMVGTKTALLDNPSLTTRLWEGKNPIRIFIDKNLQVPLDYHLLDGSVPAIIFNTLIEKTVNNLSYIKYDASINFIDQLIKSLYEKEIQSLMVEGGSTLLQSFIDAGCWDEARVITNTALMLNEGVSSPVISDCVLAKENKIKGDHLHIYNKKVNRELIK